MTHSQTAFALGLRGGLFSTRSPGRWMQLIQLGREDGVAIVQQVRVSLLIAHRLSHADVPTAPSDAPSR